MTNEAKPIELYGTLEAGDQRRFTCASAVAISKGTILTLSDPRTAAATTSTNAIFAGIASMDKESNDNSTSISAWENGIFDIYASGAVNIGNAVMTAAGATASANKVIAVTTSASAGSIVGIALESGTDEIINVRVNN